ncbi:MAG: cytochrome c biogenesis protein CcsA [Phycisphaerae bacterium]|nr:cytochrome c biogenesis protein CcsA [Phycisphaerae bacterium]
MKRIFIALMICLFPAFGRAADFADQVDLKPLGTLEIQHLQTLKTLDTFARQTMSAIHDRSSGLGDHPALYTVLDLSFRPEHYADQKIIRIRNVPLRQDFVQFPDGQQILHDGMVSPSFLSSEPVQTRMAQAQATANFKADAIGQVLGAANTVSALSQADMPLFRVIAPPDEESIWHNFGEVSGNVPLFVDVVHQNGGTVPAPVDGYRATSLSHLIDAHAAMFRLREAWRNQDATAANREIAALAAALPQINPARYPSLAKREVEVLYNRCLMLTIPAAMFYFSAFVLFLMSARSGIGSLRLWGLRLIGIAWLIHLTGIVIRWWLVSTSVGNFFESIPIKNQFESVLMSAFFGVTVGLLLELRKSRGIFGAAASFVGCLSLVAIFAAPLVFGRQIGGEIGQVNGVLMSYWLYIHVTMVTASYSLITMGFCLSLWWLIRYYRGTEKVTLDPDYLPMSSSGDVAAIGITSTLARMLFVPATRRIEIASATEARRSFLQTLDACNLVVLQLAFWTLGAGIVCGAIWADQSWGRPWGWDPKETFALVTWIVYLIVVHVRVATDDKAWWTAVLSVIGFGVMLFNWIGVNFFLVGLHSYA